jgi:hypothetical protein
MQGCRSGASGASGLMRWWTRPSARCARGERLVGPTLMATPKADGDTQSWYLCIRGGPGSTAQLTCYMWCGAALYTSAAEVSG